MASSIPVFVMTEGSVWWHLSRDPAGLASLSALLLTALLCFGSILWAPHPYDTVYSDYIAVPATLSAHPDKDELAEGTNALAERARLRVTRDDAAGTLTFSGDTAVDPRVWRYLERSDMFAQVGVPVPTDGGKILTAPIRIVRQHFLFGTDANGRDLLIRVLVAGRISLAVGLLASIVALGIGVAYGAISGYAGGRTDTLMMRGVDVVYALPFVFLVIVLLVLFGRSLWLIFLAIGAVEWLDMARITRGQTLSLKRREFVLAAEALGERGSRILIRHIVPNMIGPVVAYLALLVPRVILAESFLSFLGLGVQEPLTSWGILIKDGAGHVQGSVHLLIFPALALALTVVAANQLGEAILRAANAVE